jgi:outer membrane protein assembly factor BamE (lipoprotein component of BamABCDE complex)
MKKLVVFLMIFIFAGCATSGKTSRLQKGMTEQQVTEIMGHPDDIKTQGEYKAFRYI